MLITRRAAITVTLAAPFVARRAYAATTIRVGTLKTISALPPYFYERFAPEGVKFEVIPFDSPTDGKDALVSGTVDYGCFGIAAAILGAAARQPVAVIASVCGKGMAIVAGKDSGITTLADLKGRKVAILPGTTQEIFTMERLRMEGMSIRDITAVRVPFSEMHAALARGDVDAYVGAEPGPAISVSSGIGRVVEYPYSTEMGWLNVILAANRDNFAKYPGQAKMVVGLQRQVSLLSRSDPAAIAAMGLAKLGLNKAVFDLALPNVDIDWEMTPRMIQEAKTYAEYMLSLKQIRALPDFALCIDPSFSQQVAGAA